jgi:hypothetical protein
VAQQHETHTTYDVYLSQGGHLFTQVNISNMHHSMRDAADTLRMDFL